MRWVGSQCVVAVGFLVLAGGCSQQDVRTGQVVEPGEGTWYADFTYADVAGRRQRLSDHLGDFTVLAFTRHDKDSHGSAPARFVKLIDDYQKHGIAQTVGFDIHWSDQGCCPGGKCHLVSQGPNLYSICDGNGLVHRLYGVEEDTIFVIGPDHRIVDKGAMKDFDALRVRFGRQFRDYVDKKQKHLPQEL